MIRSTYFVSGLALLALTACGAPEDQFRIAGVSDLLPSPSRSFVAAPTREATAGQSSISPGASSPELPLQQRLFYAASGERRLARPNDTRANLTMSALFRGGQTRLETDRFGTFTTPVGVRGLTSPDSRGFLSTTVSNAQGTLTINGEVEDAMAFGTWSIANRNNTLITHSAYHAGLQTPVSRAPSGAVTYEGDVVGVLTNETSIRSGNSVVGDANVTVNFATGAVTGGLTDMRVTLSAFSARSFNDIDVSGSVTGTTLQGTLRADPVPGGSPGLPSTDAFSVGTTGSISGQVYGFNGDQLGAVGSMAEGDVSLIVSLGATR
ncbi:MAG: transferrin-binding protein-like solute binding protein [Pseudomonadota bacterium]